MKKLSYIFTFLIIAFNLQAQIIQSQWTTNVVGATLNGFVVTNIMGTNIVQNSIYKLNNISYSASPTLDVTQPYSFMIANNSISVTGFSFGSGAGVKDFGNTGLGLSSYQYLFSLNISNATGGDITYTSPSTYIFGAGSVNAFTIPTTKEAVISYWIRPNTRTNMAYSIQQ